MYSNLLNKIIYAIFMGLGIHLGGPGTLKIGPNCQNVKFLLFGRSRIKFSGCVHISYRKLPVQYFIGVGTNIGTPVTLEVGSNCQKFMFLSLVVKVSNFPDRLPL